MTIGEQIITAINNGELLLLKTVHEDRETWRVDPNATEKMNAMVHAHVEAEVKRRLEADKHIILGAIDSLGMALVAHNHKWSTGERAIYEEATKVLGVKLDPKGEADVDRLRDSTD